jgi:hypothetical protein
VIEDFQSPVDQLYVDVHCVLIEPIVEVLCQLLVLCLTIGGVLQVVLEERRFENILWFDEEDGSVGFHAVLF